MSVWIWLPVVVLNYILCAWLTHKNSSSKEVMWFWISYATTLLPLWTIIARHSKNVLYDGMVYDVTMTVTYTFAIIYFTNSFSKLSYTNYFGILLILVGMYCFKQGT